jgi:hypothetical protein
LRRSYQLGCGHLWRFKLRACPTSATTFTTTFITNAANATATANEFGNAMYEFVVNCLEIELLLISRSYSFNGSAKNDDAATAAANSGATTDVSATTAIIGTTNGTSGVLSNLIRFITILFCFIEIQDFFYFRAFLTRSLFSLVTRNSSNSLRTNTHKAA